MKSLTQRLWFKLRPWIQYFKSLTLTQSWFSLMWSPLMDCCLLPREWVWANLGRQWRTGKPGMLQSMGSQSWTRLHAIWRNSLWGFQLIQNWCPVSNALRVSSWTSSPVESSNDSSPKHHLTIISEQAWRRNCPLESNQPTASWKTMIRCC